VEPCRSCTSAITVALSIPPLPRRPSFPLSLFLCLECGFTTHVSWRDAERIDLDLKADAWHELADPIKALKRTLAERAAEADEASEET
jgi:hypothetical protein